jgi:hypothetical protein
MRTVSVFFQHLVSSFVLTREERRVAKDERRTGARWAMALSMIFAFFCGTAIAAIILQNRFTKQAALMKSEIKSEVAAALASELSSFEDRATTSLKKEIASVGTAGIEISPTVIRKVRPSVVEVGAYDKAGSFFYGSATYLGDDYFLSVKHEAFTLETGKKPVLRPKIQVRINSSFVETQVVDFGNAQAEVGPGDWVILRSLQKVDLPAVTVDLSYAFPYAEPFFRLGNDYQSGIIPSTALFGGRNPNGLLTSLADGHPGVSGGGVFERNGRLVAIPVGRNPYDYRYSFLIALKPEMFRKVPHVHSN